MHREAVALLSVPSFLGDLGPDKAPGPFSGEQSIPACDLGEDVFPRAYGALVLVGDSGSVQQQLVLAITNALHRFKDSFLHYQSTPQASAMRLVS